MKISRAIKNYLAYQKLNSKKTPYKITDIFLLYSKMNSAAVMFLR